jgi:protein-disulfide isomerase
MGSAPDRRGHHVAKQQNPKQSSGKPSGSSGKQGSSRAAREAAARAREEAMAEQKKRQRRINIAIGAGIAVLVLAIVGGAWWSSQQTKEETGAALNPDAPLPAGAVAAGQPFEFGVRSGTDPEAPVLEVWEDFQCPACKAFESVAGENLRQLAESGSVVLITRTTSFLDRRLDATSPNPGSSARAAAAYGCALDAGKGSEYKSLVFESQPAEEGEGFSDEQLTGLAEQAGITGAAKTTFDRCLADRVYLPWSANSTNVFDTEGVPGTPTVKLDGEEIETADVVDPAKLAELVADAAQAKAGQ